MCSKASHATGKDFARLGREFLKEFRILEIDCFRGDIKATTGHCAVGATEVGLALWCLGCAHGFRALMSGCFCTCLFRLFGFAVKRVASKIRIVFFFLQTTGRVEAFFIPGRSVTGDGLAFGNCLSALKCDDIAGHKRIMVGRLG